MIHPASLILSKPVLLHTHGSSYVQRTGVKERNICSFLLPLSSRALPGTFAQSRGSEAALGQAVGHQGRRGEGWGRAPPPAPTAAGTDCQRAAQRRRFVAFLPLTVTVPSSFCDAARRNNQTACLPAGCVPGHLHSQLVRHRSPCFFKRHQGLLIAGSGCAAAAQMLTFGPP